MTIKQIAEDMNLPTNDTVRPLSKEPQKQDERKDKRPLYFWIKLSGEKIDELSLAAKNRNMTKREYVKFAIEEQIRRDHSTDFTAKKILADIAGMSVNDPLNSITTKILFGQNHNQTDRSGYSADSVVYDEF